MFIKLIISEIRILENPGHLSLSRFGKKSKETTGDFDPKVKNARDYILESPSSDRESPPNRVLMKQSENKISFREMASNKILSRPDIYTQRPSNLGPRTQRISTKITNKEESLHSIDNFIQTGTIILSKTCKSISLSSGNSHNIKIEGIRSDDAIEDESNFLLPHKTHIISKLSYNSPYPNPSDKNSHQNRDISSKSGKNSNKMSSVIINHNVEEINKSINLDIDPMKDRFKGGDHPSMRNTYFHEAKPYKQNDSITFGISDIKLSETNQIYTCFKNPNSKLFQKLELSQINSKIEDHKPRCTKTTTDSLNSKNEFNFFDIVQEQRNILKSSFIETLHRKPTDELKRQYFQKKLNDIHTEYYDPLESRNVILNNMVDRENSQNPINCLKKDHLSHKEPNLSKNDEIFDASKQESSFFNTKIQLKPSYSRIRSVIANKTKSIKRNSYSRDPFVRLRVERIQVITHRMSSPRIANV